MKVKVIINDLAGTGCFYRSGNSSNAFPGALMGRLFVLVVKPFTGTTVICCTLPPVQLVSARMNAFLTMAVR